MHLYNDMESIIELLESAIGAETKEEREAKTKTSFWASEAETMAFEIFHRWMKTPVTNPTTEEKLLMMKMRKLTEESIVHFLKRTGRVVEKLTNGERVYFEWGPHKVPVSGYPDIGISDEKEPVIVEIKTYYGGRQHSDIRIGKIKSAYLKQLAIYLYHFKLSHGKLLMLNQGTGEAFEFDLYADPDGKEGIYVCPDNEIVINLIDTFKRWENIYVNYILKNVEPPIEFIYKYDIEKIDWKNTPADAIRKARNNQAVIGDWQIKYSDFKDLIIERQHTVAGYTDDELRRIRELTTGYSIKKQVNAVKFDPNSL